MKVTTVGLIVCVVALVLVGAWIVVHRLSGPTAPVPRSSRIVSQPPPIPTPPPAAPATKVPPESPPSGDYATYVNERFGVSIRYPTSTLTPDPPPENGDGRGFSNSDGFHMSVSGINNVLEDDLAGEIAEYEKDFDSVTYQHSESNWFVLSGYKGDKILYIKSYVGSGSIDTLYIKYPTALRKKYDALVTELVASFKPGDVKSTG